MSNKKVPVGRTLTTKDKYLDKNTKSDKARPVVVLDTNSHNELAVVSFSSKKGSNRTQLKNYQQGQSYFKHFVEIEDNEGKPIKVNNKFKANHKNQDVSALDVMKIKNKVLHNSKPAKANREKIDKFKKNKKSPRD